MDQKDLVLLKKSLYLIDNKDVKKGKRLLKSLADSDSNYKKLFWKFLGIISNNGLFNNFNISSIFAKLFIRSKIWYLEKMTVLIPILKIKC